LLAPGCNKPGGAAQQLTQAPTMESATGEAKCGVRSSSAKPLVVEWPAAERAALEARASRGLVAVRYQGCEMEVLTTCTANGTYEYVGLTQKREGVKITNADDLYAQLPVGAAGLEAKLERSGQLNVDMTIVGRREADAHEFTEQSLDGRCDEATHVITGLTVGAFEFYSGAAAEIGGGVKAGNVGVGASSSSSKELLKSDGDSAACSVASSSDEVAPEGCGALLRVEVVPIDKIFGGGNTATASNGGGGSSNSGPSDTGPVSADPKLDKKMRNAKLMATGGYLGALAGVGMAVYGAAFYAKRRDLLEAEAGTTMVSDDRQSNITKARTAQIVAWTGAGVGVLGIGVAILGQVRLKKLQNRNVAVSPLVGPAMAGVGVQGRF